MLNCKACIRRCIDSILFDAVPPPSRQILCSSPPWTRPPGQRGTGLFGQRRTYAFAAANSRRKDDDFSSYEKFPAAEKLRTAHRPSPTSEHKRKNDGSRSPSVADKTDTGGDRREILRELEMYRDPVRLGEHVQRTLRQGNIDKAFDLVCAATRVNVRAIVSWNHLMDYELKMGKVASALKIYNSMKKRGQRPDSHTYTILLRGLADHTHYPTAIANALTIYKSISADNSVVKQPALTHTNAVLKVCARAGEIDTMFGIAADLPTKGPGAADSRTFTTILNAVKEQAREDAANVRSRRKVGVGGNKVEEENGMREKVKGEAVGRGLRMWDDIVGRWRAGDLWIDEELVCAMGRLLLAGGKNQYVDDVFQLVEQTMAVPVQPALIASRERKVEGKVERKDKGGITKLDRHTSDESMSSFRMHGAREEDGDVAKASVTGQQVDSTFVSRSFKAGSYAQPGNNTLSLLLEACDTKNDDTAAGSKSAIQYWAVLTAAPFDLVPDLNNYNDYLRLLRRRRSSGTAVRLVCDEMAPRKDIRFPRKTFLMAMSACSRNKENPMVFSHATKLAELMVSRLPEPDIVTLCHYVDIAIRTTDFQGLERGIPGAANNIDKVVDFFNKGSVNLKVLNKNGIWDPVKDGVKSKAPGTYGVKLSDMMSRDKGNALQLIRLLTSAVDQLLILDAKVGAERGMMTPARRNRLRETKAHMSNFVTMAMVKRKKLNGGKEGEMSDEEGEMSDEERKAQVEKVARANETKEAREKREEDAREDDEIREWVRKNMPKGESEKGDEDLFQLKL